MYKLSNLLSAKSREALVSVTTPFEAWLAFGSLGVKASKDVVIITSTAKKVTAKKATIKKVVAKKAAAPKKVTAKTTTTKVFVVARLKKEVRRAILALSVAKSHTASRLCGRSLRLEKSRGYEGLQELLLLQQEVGSVKPQIARLLALWYSSQTNLAALYKVVNYVGISLA